MTTIVLARVDPRNPKLIAPLWHTGLLVAIFAGLALSGALFQHQAKVDPRMLQQHTNMRSPLPVAACHGMGFVPLCEKGRAADGIFIAALIGGDWTSARGVVVDFSLALGIWALWTLIQLTWDHLLGPSQAASIQSLLPQGAAERVLWIAVSASAGICEELTFRGYFQRQFAALARSRASVIAASGTFWNQPWISGRRSLRENRIVWPFVWWVGTVAQQPATGDGGARLGRYCQWHLWNLAVFCSSAALRQPSMRCRLA